MQFGKRPRGACILCSNRWKVKQTSFDVPRSRDHGLGYCGTNEAAYFEPKSAWRPWRLHVGLLQVKHLSFFSYYFIYTSNLLKTLVVATDVVNLLPVRPTVTSRNIDYLQGLLEEIACILTCVQEKYNSVIKYQ